MPDAILDKMSEIVTACRQHRTSRLEVFGLAARGVNFNPETRDADCLVTFLPPVCPGDSDRDWGLADDLESRLGRKVDLVTEMTRPDRNPFFRESVNDSREQVDVV